MCMSRAPAPAPTPAPPVAAPAVSVPEAPVLNEDTVGVEGDALNTKKQGIKKLKIDKNVGGVTEGAGLNVPGGATTSTGSTN